MRRLLWVLPVLLMATGCNQDDQKARVSDEPYEKLSDYGFFAANLASLTPTERVLPYDLNTPLFSDYAEKARFVWMPEGTAASYTDDGVLDFPEGATLIKNFFYYHDEGQPDAGRRIIETRLLVRQAGEWEAHSYIWNDEQTEAHLEIVGDIKEVTWKNKAGLAQSVNYIVPNKNQCKGCHYNKGVQEPIGPKVRNLNRDYAYVDGPKNQLVKWAEFGYLEGFEPGAEHPRVAQWDNPESGTLHERAMAYLDINCGHCHNPRGPANTTGLNLVADAPTDLTLGILKPTVAAGRGTGGFDYNIVPGKPEVSILAHRMKSNEPAVMMPELGRRMVHEEGVALIEEWIGAME